MKEAIILVALLSAILISSCSKEKVVSEDQALLGVWELDSTIIDTNHSMWFKSKKYEFKESGDFFRNYPLGLQDFGTWNYNTNTHILLLKVDSLYEEYPTLVEELEIHSISPENLVIVEDYDSIFLENGNIEFIKEYYSKKK